MYLGSKYPRYPSGWRPLYHWLDISITTTITTICYSNEQQWASSLLSPSVSWRNASVWSTLWNSFSNLLQHIVWLSVLHSLPVKFAHWGLFTRGLGLVDGAYLLPDLTLETTGSELRGSKQGHHPFPKLVHAFLHRSRKWILTCLEKGEGTCHKDKHDSGTQSGLRILPSINIQCMNSTGFVFISRMLFERTQNESLQGRQLNVYAFVLQTGSCQ